MTLAIGFIGLQLAGSALVLAMGLALARKREAQDAVIEKSKRKGVAA
jgi:hypothetical protein